MPVHQDKKTGKWAIGKGKFIYPDKATANRAYSGYLGAKYGGNKGSKEHRQKIGHK